MSGFELNIQQKANAVRNISGQQGKAKVHSGTVNGLRKSLAFVERLHKRGNKFMLPGGGKKNPAPAQWPFIRTRTGTLKKSYTRVLDKAKLIASYGSDLRYAQMIEEGTRPHEIHAAKGKALAFMAGGKKIYRRFVLHPGIKARKHMPKLEKLSAPVVERYIADAVVKELARGK